MESFFHYLVLLEPEYAVGRNADRRGNREVVHMGWVRRFRETGSGEARPLL